MFGSTETMQLRLGLECKRWDSNPAKTENMASTHGLSTEIILGLRTLGSSDS